MDRNSVLAFILIGLVLMLWLWYNTPDPSKLPKKSHDTTQVQTKKLEEKKSEEKLSENKIQPEDTLGIYFSSVEVGKNSITTVETPLYKIEINSTGGKFNRVFLKKYKEWYGGLVQLINTKDGGDLNLSFVTKDGKLISTAPFEFKPEFSQNYINLTDQDSITKSFVLKINDTTLIRKKFTFYKDKYFVRVDLEFKGMDRVLSGNRYSLDWENGIRFVEKNTFDEASFAKVDYYAANELFNFDATSFGQKIEKKISGVFDWVAIRNKYFAISILPLQKDPDGMLELEGEKKALQNGGVIDKYSLSISKNLPNFNYAQDAFNIYFGPIEYNTLKSHHPTMTSIVDFGSFLGLTFIIRPIAEYLMLPLLKFLHSFIPNYGIVIIIFSLIIKIALHPLTKQSMNSMKKMQLLQPMMNEIREKYKDDPQKMNQEVMKLYQTYGINPAGGCLPILLQMPILIALYGLFRATIELRQQPFMLWITDLSVPDTILHLPFRLPIFMINEISGLALLLGITMFIQQKMTVTDPRQKAMVYIMPILLTLLFNSFPSGLNLYYFMFNILSIAHQHYVNKYSKPIELKPVDRKSKKGFMQKLMEQAEQNAKERRKRLAKGKF
ncbi:MAG: membrane protein insertase YidC [Ignavibacteria bacterium]|nr:membrane protein insertase YidC [Ignavibacteria bacterium]